MLLALSLALSGCGYRRAHIPPPTAEFNQQPDPVFAENREHRLGPSDLVTVSVYRASEFSGDYRVDASGNIMVPLLGLMQVQGMTTIQLADNLRQQLSGRYYVNPDVSVALKESNSQRVSIDGSVGSPGVYPVVGRMTLMEAIARAGGTSGGADLRRIVIFRQIQGQRMAAAFDLTDIRRGRAEDPVIYTGDIIVVDGSRLRAIQREILGSLPLLSVFRPY